MVDKTRDDFVLFRGKFLCFEARRRGLHPWFRMEDSRGCLRPVPVPAPVGGWETG